MISNSSRSDQKSHDNQEDKAGKSNHKQNTRDTPFEGPKAASDSAHYPFCKWPYPPTFHKTCHPPAPK
jgi:hypothetical protein